MARQLSKRHLFHSPTPKLRPELVGPPFGQCSATPGSEDPAMGRKSGDPGARKIYPQKCDDPPGARRLDSRINDIVWRFLKDLGARDQTATQTETGELEPDTGPDFGRSVIRKHRNLPSGRKADVGALQVAIRPKSGPAGRSPIASPEPLLLDAYAKTRSPIHGAETQE